MERILAVVPFESLNGRAYLYDDNTGMVFPSSAALQDLLKAHIRLPLDAARAELADRHDPGMLASAAQFVERCESRFGAFYRSPEYRDAVEKQMQGFSGNDLKSLIREHGFGQLLLVLTENCNLRCSYCYYSEAYPLTRSRTAKQLSVETGRKALDFYFDQAATRVASNPMVKLAINFYGGEPLMAQQTLRELTQYAKATAPAELVFAVTTNGTLLHREIGDFLVDQGFYVLVSLDGGREDHDRNRFYEDGKGSFDRIVENLRSFRSRHPDYPHFHLTGVFDWGTDLLRVNEFFNDNACWLPSLQMVSQANDRDTNYYRRFSEQDRLRFLDSHRQLEKIYLDARLSGALVPPFARVYFEARLVGALLRKRQGNLPFPILPFTNTCLPGWKLAVRTDGTLDICERVNGTMPIGHLDTGLDFDRIERTIREYNKEICRACWACPVTKLCAHCFASCNTDQGFARGNCRETVAGIGQSLAAIYGIREQHPDAFSDLSYFNPELTGPQPMRTPMRYFRLHQDVFFEHGAKAGALYDFMRRRVVRLSPVEAEVLDQLERNVPVDEVRGALPAEVQGLIERLEADECGRRMVEPWGVDRYMPVLNLAMSGLVEPPLVISALHLAISSSCSLACEGCGHGDDPVWQGCNGCERWPGVPRDAAWTPTALDQLLDQIDPLDVRHVSFSGGDPLAEPETLLRAIERLRGRARPVNVLVITNGVGAEPRLMDRFAELGVHLNFVLLGGNPAEYREACGAAAAFGATMDAIGAAQVRSIPFYVTLRIDGADREAVARRRDWAATLGARGVFTSERVRIRADGGIEPLRSLPTIGPERVTQVGPEQLFARRERNPCLSGVLAVGADGSVRPCPMIEDRALGHLGVETLRDILRKRRHERYWKLTKDDVPGCDACELRYACADCAAVDLAKRRVPALHAAVCAYDPARAEWRP